MEKPVPYSYPRKKLSAQLQTLISSGYLLDPHTSVAKAVADRFQSDTPMLISATAHPGKFANDVLKIINGETANLSPAEMVLALVKHSPRPVVHRSLLKTLEKHFTYGSLTCDADYESIVTQVELVANKI